ncbi:FAD/NAD(P)-binding protein [Streptomyces sp. WMMC500]|uniref:FAD/NAD(P)-binding protein n=1 Tax=Streptomyces sp. WMMC500 TaxID=3015154 RepID=UPI00248B3BA0|nr:FAD/NAD(P)-binding protein [Streptomyces sp. WMMC500]WBB59256.1 FAD/NAD(P)-binding protein [Streptomyces sp. WMMC500]
MSHGQLNVCVVGAGPRGLSVLERICANERKSPAHEELRIHVIDPHPPGAGRVWRTDQPDLLLMNTVASQVTVYTDTSVEMDGPIEAGPSLYEWAQSVVRGDDAGPALPGGALAEARQLGPDDYPTRAFYGHYLGDTFRRVVAGAPEHVTVHVHRTTAVALDEEEGAAGQCLTLADGTRLRHLDAVVLAQGHLPARATEREKELAREAAECGLVLVTPVNPADADLSAIRPGQPVVLRGLGLNFFDHLALLTTGRGGRFERSGDRLVYRPSGREPLLYAGSRRGVPYHARGHNEKGAHGRYEPRLLTPEVIAKLRERTAEGRRVYFAVDLWPLIAKEVASVYYGALLAANGREAEREAFVARYLASPTAEVEAALLDEHGIPAADRWDWARIDRPYATRDFHSRAEFRDWLLGHLADDVREAREGNVSGPLKAALDVLRDLRNEIRLVVDHGGLEGISYRDDLQNWYTPLNAYLSIGPPASRIEETIALANAGILEFMGPELRVRIDRTGEEPAFVAESSRVQGPPVRAAALIEARLPEPDIRRTADPLLTHLLATGQCRPYRLPSDSGADVVTGGLAVGERPYPLIDAAGRRHPRRFAYGVPTEAVHWVTAAGIRPGVNSVTLGDSDAIARAVLALTAASGPRPHATEEPS